MTCDDLASDSTRDHLRRNGIPTADDLDDRSVALTRIREVLGGGLPEGGLHESRLGTGWTEVFRAVLPVQPDADTLIDAGWLSLDGLRRHCGLSATGCWGVTDRTGRVLAAVELAAPAGDDVATVVRRAQERGAVRLRDVLELRELKKRNNPFPDASRVLTAAADIETGLGERELVRWTSGRRSAAPTALASIRPHRLVVACSGVDGAGKTTLLEALRRDLERCAVPVSRVWLRPGMGLGRLVVLARWVKRRGGLDEEPGINRVAADPEAVLVSRRGLRGWVWSLLVSVSFIAGVRTQHASTRGVVLYDRHLVDALVTLEFAYAGVDLRLQRWLIRRLIPRADVVLHLEVPVDEAVRRKPGDPIGRSAVERQVARYDAWVGRVGKVVRLDGTNDPGALARHALGLVLDAG